ncbi:MAG: RNA polymerase sigma-54 factor, partial [Melioribacteraceae bacterium]
TISRVVNGKYVQSPQGIHELKFFFSEGLATDSGDEVSNKHIKMLIDEICQSESKKSPYSDDKIAKILKDKGIHIARRTVAKYREQLKIPVARLRKEL